MRGRVVTLVVVIGLMGVSVGAASAAAGSTTPHFRDERVWNPAALDWEPTVATDPSSHYMYQMTTRYGGKVVCGQYPHLQHCLVFRASSDGGRTWGPDHVMCPPCDTVQFQNDPEIRVATDGTIYAAWLNNWRVVFAKSTDHGATWTEPTGFRKGIGGAFTDKPMLAISAGGKDVYVAFNSSDSYVAASHDYGDTFSPPVKTNNDGRYWFAEGGAVAPDGTVYFSDSAENQDSTGTVQLWVLRSFDGGLTWKQTLVATSQQQPPCTGGGCYADFYGSQIGLAIDTAGTIMVEYASNAADEAPLSMYTATSTDGKYFSSPVLVSGGAWKVGADFPAIAAGQSAGDFRLAFMDDRNGKKAWNTWFRQTSDGGATWTDAVRLSNRASGASYKGPDGYWFPDGDYMAIAVGSSGTNYVVWGESPSYAISGGTWFTRGE